MVRHRLSLFMPTRRDTVTKVKSFPLILNCSRNGCGSTAFGELVLISTGGNRRPTRSRPIALARSTNSGVPNVVRTVFGKTFLIRPSDIVSDTNKGTPCIRCAA